MSTKGLLMNVNVRIIHKGQGLETVQISPIKKNG